MKATELRIGNWVFNKAHERKQLTEIYADASVYDPIPLTEEWLLKFGFEKGNINVPAFEKDNLMVEWLFERWTGRLCYDWQTSIQITELTSVHQLQNLYFVLTGDELTIE
jgi:hypothetical protein